MNEIRKTVPAERTNLWKVYIYRFFSDFWLIAPVLVPFYESNGLSATQVFIVQAIYAISLLIFEFVLKSSGTVVNP